MIYDLHSHSTASDGMLSPEQLVKRAVERRVDVLALTDHDTTAGLQAGWQAIAADDLPLTLISGVEISCSWEGMEIHIVGLGFDEQHPTIRALLDAQAERRRVRAEGIAAKLEKIGIHSALEKAQALAEGGAVTRAHFARVLKADGVVDKLDTAFKKYLRKGKRAYVSPGWCSIEQAIEAIQGAGGVAVVAHPTKYQISWKWVRKLLESFAGWGGDAVEVAMTQQMPNEKRKLADLAVEFGLLASQGSDFHYPESWVELGKNLWLPSGIDPIWQRWEAQK
ncbi:RNase AM [Corallincola platygyrae]